MTESFWQNRDLTDESDADVSSNDSSEMAISDVDFDEGSSSAYNEENHSGDNQSSSEDVSVAVLDWTETTEEVKV